MKTQTQVPINTTSVPAAIAGAVAESRAAMHVPTQALTAYETKELAALEAIVENGVKTFLQVGEALLKIREKRLYRGTHATFDAYCREHWAMSKTHANRVIASAAVAKNLAPLGVKPTSEAQVRVLSSLPSESQRKVWKQAEKATGGHPEAITARILTDTAKALGVRATVQAQASTRRVHEVGNVANVTKAEVIEFAGAWIESEWETLRALATPEAFLAEFKALMERM